MGEEERAAALAAYATETEAFSAALAAAKADTEVALAAAKYNAAKYKLAADPEMKGFAERMDAIEALLASGAVSGDLSAEEKLRTAYYIDRGKQSAAPSAEELFARLQASPEAMRLAEAAILERLRTEGGGMPALSASVGGAGLPLTPKTKPKTLSEAAALAREAFGV